MHFIWIAEGSRLLTRIGMRDKGKLPILDFAPPACVTRTDVEKINRTCELSLARARLG